MNLGHLPGHGLIVCTLKESLVSSDLSLSSMRPHLYHIKDKIIAYFNYTAYEAWKFGSFL